MADVVLNPGSGGSTVHTVTRTGKETQVVGLDLTPGGGSETLMNGSMPVTAASLPLPAGASTAAKQPALGTAGTPSADVLSVQGAPSMTPVKTDGSGVTQPVSGPLTDTQLRSTAVPVSGTVTATGPLTDTQLRATAVPVSTAALAADNAAGLPSVVDVVGGYDGTNVQALATNAAGNLQVGLSASLPAGANAVGKLAANSGVVIGDVNAVTLPGSLAGKAEDAASASGDVGVPILGVRRDSINTSWTSTDGDYMMLSTNAVGALYVVTQDPMPISDNGTAVRVDVNKVAGTATDVNSGNKSPGTQRFVIATDQPQLTNAFKVDPSGVTSPVSLAALPTLAAGTNNIGFVTPTPSTTGGWTPKVFTALTNTKTLIKNGAGTLGGYLPIWNPNVAVAYIQVFDFAATASVTLGTTVPDAIIPIPPGSAANLEASLGVHFANGIVIAITTTAGGSTAPGTGLDGTLLYK